MKVKVAGLGEEVVSADDFTYDAASTPYLVSLAGDTVSSIGETL